MLPTRPVLVVWGMHRLFEATPRFEISPVHCLHGCQLNFPKEQAILSDDSSQAVESRNLGAEGKKCKVRFSLVFLTCNAGRLTSIRIERIFICLRSVTPTAIWIAARLLTPLCHYLSVNLPHPPPRSTFLLSGCNFCLSLWRLYSTCISSTWKILCTRSVTSYTHPYVRARFCSSTYLKSHQPSFGQSQRFRQKDVCAWICCPRFWKYTWFGC